MIREANLVPVGGESVYVHLADGRTLQYDECSVYLEEPSLYMVRTEPPTIHRLDLDDKSLEIGDGEEAEVADVVAVETKGDDAL